MYHQFGASDREVGKKRGSCYRKWMLAWMFCLAVMLWGCGISGGGDQITKMDERYLARQESPSPGPEKDSSKDGVQTEVPEGDTEGNSSRTSRPQEDSQSDQDVSSKSTNSPAGNDKSNQNTSSSSKNQSQRKKSSASNAQSESKDRSAKNHKTKSKKSSSVTSSPNGEQDASQKENTGDDGKEQEEKKDGEGIHCFVSIDCKTILSNLSKLKETKKDYVPKDGVILKKTRVTVKEGTSVYDVLYQVCRDKNIHLEAAYTPMYGTYYVEGIHQLYEFDCGDLSGWNYTVNGKQPNLGCSKYQVQEGDVIVWRFTCDRGKDL